MFYTCFQGIDPAARFMAALFRLRNRLKYVIHILHELQPLVNSDGAERQNRDIDTLNKRAYGQKQAKTEDCGM